MSARPITVPGSVQRETKRDPEIIYTSEQTVMNLAYALWQARGCPQGSPEEDWFEAEEMVRPGRRP